MATTNESGTDRTTQSDTRGAKTTALVTGATSGIGRHAAVHLARQGCRVLTSGRKRSAPEAPEAEAGALGLETPTLDVTDPASIVAARAEVDRRTEGRGVDLLINNAGYGLAAPVAEVSDQDLRTQFDTNVFGLMAVTRAFLPRMIDRGAGRVINVPGVGGRVTFPFFGAHNASKYAVEALSDALRLEVAPFSVKVVLVEPGPIRSDFAEKSRGVVDRYASDDSLYAPVYAVANEIQAKADAAAVGPERTSRAIERAIVARRPATRYVVPLSSRVTLWALHPLPTPLVDALMRRMMGLTAGTLRVGERRGLARVRTAA